MLAFKKKTYQTHLILPNGEVIQPRVEIRTDPITGRTCRITYSRIAEKEPGVEARNLPGPPPGAVPRANQCAALPSFGPGTLRFRRAGGTEDAGSIQFELDSADPTPTVKLTARLSPLRSDCRRYGIGASGPRTRTWRNTHRML